MCRLVLGLASLLFASDAMAHDWYTELMVPGTSTPCCSGRDCRPAEPCKRPDGREGLTVDDYCVPITEAAVLPNLSPDGKNHVCVAYLDGIPYARCIVRGGGS